MSEKYSIYTLVDITPTGALRPGIEYAQQKVNQQKNLNTLLQTVSMRSVFTDYTVSQINKASELPEQVTSMPMFQSKKRKYSVWRLDFETDRDGVFGTNYQHLIDDLNRVPVITGLSGTYQEKNGSFYTAGNKINTVVIKND